MAWIKHPTEVCGVLFLVRLSHTPLHSAPWSMKMGIPVSENNLPNIKLVGILWFWKLYSRQNRLRWIIYEWSQLTIKCSWQPGNIVIYWSHSYLKIFTVGNICPRTSMLIKCITFCGQNRILWHMEISNMRYKEVELGSWMSCGRGKLDILS